jgi:hypothetical protein
MIMNMPQSDPRPRWRLRLEHELHARREPVRRLGRLLLVLAIAVAVLGLIGFHIEQGVINL